MEGLRTDLSMEGSRYGGRKLRSKGGDEKEINVRRDGHKEVGDEGGMKGLWKDYSQEKAMDVGIR